MAGLPVWTAQLNSKQLATCPKCNTRLMLHTTANGAWIECPIDPAHFQEVVDEG